MMLHQGVIHIANNTMATPDAGVPVAGWLAVLIMVGIVICGSVNDVIERIGSSCVAASETGYWPQTGTQTSTYFGSMTEKMTSR